MKVNPIYSYLKYKWFKWKKRVVIIDSEGEILDFGEEHPYEVFKEIYLKDHDNKIINGRFIFRVRFKAPRYTMKEVLENTEKTIPFFAGLPGFCQKKFCICKESEKFRGVYEWETVKDAKNYSRSFAMKFMKKRSVPFPISFEIVDKNTNQVILTTFGE